MGDNITPIQDEKESFTTTQEIPNTSISSLNQEENKETNFPDIIDVSSLSLEEEKAHRLKIEEEKNKGYSAWISSLCDRDKKIVLDIMELKKYIPSALLLSRNNKDLLKITNCKFEEMYIYEGYFIICNLNKNVRKLIKKVWRERKSLKCNYALDKVWTGWQIIIPIICGLGAMVGGLGLWEPKDGWAYLLGFAVFALVFFLVSFIYSQYQRRRRLYYSEYYG